MKRLLVALAFVVAALVQTPGRAAEARVTNCWHYDSYDYTQGRCGGRDANPPYTTQWALMLQCTNGTVTSGWRNAGTISVLVHCIGSGRRVGSAWFLFR
jgi:hypothetical protein